MREIKFRGLTIQSHMWECGDLIKDRNGKCFIHFYDCNGFECSYEVIPETVGQYTGLKDKNGEEIYGGDVVNVIHRISKLSGIGRVYWCDDGAYWGIRTMLPFLLHTADEVEVLGNIHQNPELLKGE